MSFISMLTAIQTEYQHVSWYKLRACGGRNPSKQWYNSGQPLGWFCGTKVSAEMPTAPHDPRPQDRALGSAAGSLGALGHIQVGSGVSRPLTHHADLCWCHSFFAREITTKPPCWGGCWALIPRGRVNMTRMQWAKMPCASIQVAGMNNFYHQEVAIISSPMGSLSALPPGSSMNIHVLVFLPSALQWHEMRNTLDFINPYVLKAWKNKLNVKRNVFNTFISLEAASRSHWAVLCGQPMVWSWGQKCFSWGHITKSQTSTETERWPRAETHQRSEVILRSIVN